MDPRDKGQSCRPGAPAQSARRDRPGTSLQSPAVTLAGFVADLPSPLRRTCAASVSERPEAKFGKELTAMRNYTATKKTQNQTHQGPASRLATMLFVALLFAALSGFAEEIDPAQQPGWGDDSNAKELSMVRPVAVNPEEVEMLRRLLGLAATQPEPSPAPEVAGECAAG